MKIIAVLTACLMLDNGLAFAPVNYRTNSVIVESKSQLFAGQFDLSKPVFDLFTLRSIRGDALLRYGTLNQSEPLRINLYALLALSLFAFPSLSESVGFEPAGLTQTGGCIVGGLGSLGLFARECQRRSNQLYRIEKELNSELLKLRLPMNLLSNIPFTDPATFGMLMKTSLPPRIVVVSGTSKQLSDALSTLQIFGRRLRQASTFVVPVPTDGSTRKDWNLGSDRLLWLADAYELDTWLQYFDGLSEDSKDFRWFALNSSGRSFGSGAGNEPQWLELLGQYLRPSTILDETDSNALVTDETRSVLNAQTEFYSALTNGDMEGMKSVCLAEPSPEVTEVVEAGGRIDGWDSCLKDGARPEGMKLSGSDAVILSETEAYSTIIEFPAISAAGGMTATLLAVQQWSRASPNDKWKLVLHQTIPWTSETRAQGTLRCDCRGCVALTREAEKRTFGGMIG